ncbi:hypothetical protein B0H11DRAFT_1898599 [Mycena galericulata]|nr:hypothetical protein B0H11DRAFT_1898599 [Mycena galericulata]
MQKCMITRLRKYVPYHLPFTKSQLSPVVSFTTLTTFELVLSLLGLNLLPNKVQPIHSHNFDIKRLYSVPRAVAAAVWKHGGVPITVISYNQRPSCKRDPVLHVPYIVDPWQFFRHQVFKVLISWFNLQVLLNIPEGLALQNFDSSEIHIIVRVIEWFDQRFPSAQFRAHCAKIISAAGSPEDYPDAQWYDQTFTIPLLANMPANPFEGSVSTALQAPAPPPADPFAVPTRSQEDGFQFLGLEEHRQRPFPKRRDRRPSLNHSASTSSAAAKGKSRASEREPSLTIYDSDDAELLSTITLPPKKSAPSPPAPKTSRPADPVVEEPPQPIPTYIPNVIPHDLVEDAVLPADVQNVLPFSSAPLVSIAILIVITRTGAMLVVTANPATVDAISPVAAATSLRAFRRRRSLMMATSNSTLMLLLQQVVNLRRQVEMSAYQYRANLLDYDDAINIFAKNYFYAESVLPESAFTAKFHDPRSQQLIKDLFVRFDVTRERAQYLAKLHYAERLVTQEISSVPRQVRAPVPSDSSVSIANLVGSVPVLQDVPHLATVSKVDAVPAYLRANPVKPFPVVWVPDGASPIVETSAPVAGPPLESAPHAPGASAFGEPFFSIFERQAAVAGSSRSASAAPSTGHFFGNLRSSPVADGPAGSVPGGAESPEAPMDVA